MLTVLWSTPRTGSTWYAQYLYNKLLIDNKTTVFLRQYLNKFQFETYYLPNQHNEIYTYDPRCYYRQYFLEPLGKKITSKQIFSERILDTSHEEAYRIWLLEKANLKKFPLFIHQHVMPMNKDTYFYLKNKATKNVYLYRENFIDQAASYVVATFTNKFRRAKNEDPIIVENAEIEDGRLEYLLERIKYWHSLDKTNCEVIKYEDIDFSKNDYTAKQNIVKPIEQVSKNIYDKILELNNEYQDFINELKRKSLPYLQ